ncbi:MAG: hypothetical protein GY739_13985, partial [Mesoflavibacter sp.]|nr:hypothetical protein [Mesoflavibacter sp.]
KKIRKLGAKEETSTIPGPRKTDIIPGPRETDSVDNISGPGKTEYVIKLLRPKFWKINGSMLDKRIEERTSIGMRIVTQGAVSEEAVQISDSVSDREYIQQESGTMIQGVKFRSAASVVMAKLFYFILLPTIFTSQPMQASLNVKHYEIDDKGKMFLDQKEEEIDRYLLKGMDDQLVKYMKDLSSRVYTHLLYLIGVLYSLKGTSKPLY